MARLRRVWLYFAAICAVLLCACFFVAGEVGRTRALEDLEAAVRTDANLKMALLRAVLEHPRALPLVLSEDTELRDTLKGRSPTAIDGLNRKLETLVEGTRASVIYVVGLDGVAIASSNWGTTESFVGNDYSFREYFRLAIAGGGAEHYALGSVSHRPGLYISRRIDDVGGAAVGVVVVKTEFDGLEADWRSTGRPVFVSDDRGIVLLTSVPAWRFMAVQPIEPDRLKAIRDSLQFGEAPLLPLPYRPAEAGSAGSVVRIALPGAARPNDYLDVAVPVPTTQWTLHHLAPLDPTVPASERESRLLWLAALVPLLAGAAVLLWRREAGIRRMAAEQDARMELERRVEARTVDLSRARDRLQQEIEVRQDTEERLQAVQQNLVRANRLAILGQVAAGVAHEINQPVATIRAYADNARTFLDRSQIDPVRENLQFIAGLTERIGTITGELRGLARKGRAAAEPTGLADAIEGAVALLRTRFAGGMECLDIALPPADLKVSASRIRLEQVLINLLQNALEAVGARDGGRVAVRVETSGEDEMALSVEDNGPGIAGDIRQALFTPFNTSKESGLGLGLVISKEILADYGGRIEVDSSDRGTRFTIYLKRA